MMARITNGILIVFAIVFCTSCDGMISEFVNGAQRIPVLRDPSAIGDPLLLKSSYLDPVSASHNFEFSISGYKVRQSVGILLNKQYSITPGGYKAFVNLNGRFTSEEMSH